MFKLMPSTFLPHKIYPSTIAVKGASEIGGAPGGLPPNAPYHASRPVSRVLYGAKQERTLRVTAIPLERRLPGVSSNLPGRPIRTSIRGFLPVPPLFGLAPGGVYRAACVAAGAVRSCRTVSPLPRDFARGGLRFLWHFPWGHPRRALSGTACPWSPDFPPRRPFGPAGTAVRPTDSLAMGSRRLPVKGRGHPHRPRPRAAIADRSATTPACRASN